MSSRARPAGVQKELQQKVSKGRRWELMRVAIKYSLGEIAWDYGRWKLKTGETEEEGGLQETVRSWRRRDQSMVRGSSKGSPFEIQGRADLKNRVAPRRIQEKGKMGGFSKKKTDELKKKTRNR